MSRRTSISARDFCSKFIPMAREGKSAVEIGRALGLEGEDIKVAQYVTTKASQLRKKFVEAALSKLPANASAKRREATESEAKAKIPVLQGRGRKKEDMDELASFVEGLVNSVNEEE